MSNEPQKDEKILPGGLGTIDDGEIIKSESDYQKGTLTLTVAPPKLQPVYGILANLFLERDLIEDADFEVI